MRYCLWTQKMKLVYWVQILVKAVFIFFFLSLMPLRITAIPSYSSLNLYFALWGSLSRYIFFLSFFLSFFFLLLLLLLVYSFFFYIRFLFISSFYSFFLSFFRQRSTLFGLSILFPLLFITFYFTYLINLFPITKTHVSGLRQFWDDCR